MTNLERAKGVLRNSPFTCVAIGDEDRLSTTERGVSPLLSWLDEGIFLEGYAVADRVVGKGAAMLYALLRPAELHAEVMSRGAFELLQVHGIRASYDTLVDGIRNRTNTGPCPMEDAVGDITDPQEALVAMRERLKLLRG